MKASKVQAEQNSAMIYSEFLSKILLSVKLQKCKEGGKMFGPKKRREKRVEEQFECSSSGC